MKKNSILRNIFILIINFWNYYKYTKKFFKLMTNQYTSLLHIQESKKRMIVILSLLFLKK